MDIVKKNWISIACGVVALLAIIASFWPLGSNKEALAGKLQQRITAYNQAKQILSNRRHLPTLDPDSTEAAQLTAFPNDSIITEGKRATEKVRQQSAAMLARAVEINRRPVLVSGSLPNPAPAGAFAFRDAYKHEMLVELPKLLNGGMPPSKETFEQAKTQLWDNKYAPKLVRVNGQVDPTSEKQLKDAYEIELSQLPRQLMEQQAHQIALYVNSDALEWNPRIATQDAPPAAEIWDAQLKLWVQREAIAGIQAANAGAADVLGAAVKHLLSIRVKPYAVAAAAAAIPGGGGNNNAAETPSATAAAPDASVALAPNFAVSVTGRVSNAFYDVVPFTLVINVDADKIDQVLKSLSRNRFVTVQDVEVVGIDSGVAFSEGYLYGSAPIARLTVQCEMLFLRDWTVELMPYSVRQFLGAAVKPSTPAG